MIRLSKYILIFLCFASLCFARGDYYKGVKHNCTTSNDSSQWAPNQQDDDSVMTANWRAQKISLGSNITVTGYHIVERDINQTGSDTVVMMNHDAINDYPDETSEVSGTEITFGNASIPDGDPPGTTDFDIASPRDVDAGTYWVVIKEVGGMASSTYTDTTSTGDRYCNSYNSGSTWTCTNGRALNIEVYGCLR